MKDEKITLSFMNEGKPFDVPTMTVGRQEEYMEMMDKIEKEIKDEDQRNRKASKLMILGTLQLVDKNVTMEHINNMHPSDYVYISNLLWESGQELGKDEPSDFQKTK